MKRFLDRTWAKCAAFFLTLLFGALTVLGGAGVVVLANYNVFLDGGEYLRQTLYEDQCRNAIYNADNFLRTKLANIGLLANDGTYDYSIIGSESISEEEQRLVVEDLPRAFAEEFSRDNCDCHLSVRDGESDKVAFENFALTDGDTPLCSTQELFVYTLADGQTAIITISADLLHAQDAASYSYLLLTWLLEHTALTVLLTVFFALLTLLCFCFSLASAGHWQGHEGIHLTWLDRIPADVWVVTLLTVFLLGWDAFYLNLGRDLFCGALIPFVLLFLCAFTAQCKAGTVIRRSLAARLLRFLWRILRHMTVRLPLVWKTALATLGLTVLEFILYVSPSRDPLFLVVKLAELLAVLYIAVSLRTLQRGGEKLARGDFSEPIDTRFLLWDFKRYGQELNDVQGGLEQALQEQMKSERLKTELITNVSHDIKTPLTSIVNYVDLLQKEDISSPAAREYIAVLDRQSKRLKKLTEDLVEASKASSGTLTVELQPTDVNVLLSQVEGEYQERLASCHLTLVVQPPQPGTTIRADSRLLSRVMDNLVSNVCKYALPGTRVYVAGSVQNGSVTISFKNVSRDELNISPDELMERFVRGDASRHTEGSGLGLSIARSLVQLQGGTFALSIDADLFRADITFPLLPDGEAK